MRANTFVGPVARNNPFRPQPPEKVANLEMHEEQEQVTLENVDVQAPEKHTGDLSKGPPRLRQRRGSTQDTPRIHRCPQTQSEAHRPATSRQPVPPGHTTRARPGDINRQSQLDPGTVLTGRYEITRRIGGGGMGAVYLAKDRNLGDASRAVKEMVEAHLDPLQHEKAIGDFKRESCC